ncbi:MAG TPA: hypothetical protein VGC18_04500 [Lacisediminihabitans sp.]|uniref:hypothetical protein n=1 Tax=Lacisediminihabitans sp. TaxID=2787631 RepID=UPI002ED8D199
METIGGYRLVRELGEGVRARVWLGHSGSAESPGLSRTAAVKVFRSETSLGSIDDEIEALARVSSEHVLELVDLATGHDGRPALILPRLQPAGLGRLVALRPSLRAGEAVTALAPIVGAVGELHRVGVVHGRIQLPSVLLGPGGRPVLAGFGRAGVVGDLPADDRAASLTPARAAENERLLGDLRDLVHMTGALLEHVPREPAVVVLLDWLEVVDPGAAPYGFIDELVERLFDLAPALPLPVGPLPVDSDEDVAVGGFRGSATRQRLIPLREPVPAPPDVLRRPRRPRGSPGWAERLAGHLARSDPRSAIGGRVRRAVGSVRRPVWIAGGAGVVALVVGFGIIPSARNEPPISVPAPSSSVRGSAAPAAAAEPAVRSDDPVAAATALLAIRAGCIAALSVPCLERADQKGSASMDADSAAIGRARSGAPRGGQALDGLEPRLVQRLGDSAILELTPVGGASVEGGPAGGPPESGAEAETDASRGPASLLVVRGEAGWRIRDVILG